MKKLILFFIICTFSTSSISKAGSFPKYGKGDLQLSDYVVDMFIYYLRGGIQKYPSDFFVTTDGSDGQYWYCPASDNCMPGNIKEDIKQCERKTGKICRKFARKRIIKWDNGINKGKKDSKINSRWTDQEIKAKLTELGFYKNY